MDTENFEETVVKIFILFHFIDFGKEKEANILCDKLKRMLRYHNGNLYLNYPVNFKEIGELFKEFNKKANINLIKIIKEFQLMINETYNLSKNGAIYSFNPYFEF